MGRRQAREAALQTMFQIDIGRVGPEAALAHVHSEAGLKAEDLQFARELVMGTIEHLSGLDAVITRLSRDWRLDRLAAVDRNLMRLALFEIFYRDDIPSGVSVNEAVELAKAFGGPESGRFINGILGRVVKDPAAYNPAGT
ncbi:transcription antitermination factor NusB [Desulfotomaculum copahuensis]|uniref:Transcription antitermination protein NusB n=1 Tax=Desulfotomaculum copahuensis TaxID=1838280 RepID=A0A1B7LIX6_9FIRM|nr:transcription antitermination factor NusB [Desulfotomaculum copahuensis]OAT86529.1 transcription antitermination factor NusB [Desulfotomaculum copahuensis]